MNILIDKLPHQVKIDGVNYQINCDFRTSIKFELLIQESESSQREKIIETLKLYFNVIPKNIDVAIERIIWFYSCGNTCKTPKEDQKEKRSIEVNQRAYSFNYDKNYIFSAFYQVYGIDLTKENLHWWKFKALFSALPDECLFSKIMYYRTVEISSKMSREYQQRLRELKEIYALPLTESEQRRINDLENALLKGDLSGIDL